MPRKSAAAITNAVPRVDGRPDRLAPPAHLSDAARAIWHELVAALPPEHLRPTDVPLVESYAEWTATARRAARELAEHGEVASGRASPWLVVAEKAQRAQTALALRLRLCPSSRTDPKTVGRNGGADGPVVDFSELR